MREEQPTSHTPACPSAGDQLLKAQALADWLGVTPGALAQMRYLGKGPKFIKLGGRSVRYRVSDVNEWLDAQTRQQT
ncbi:helix-turn-helix transcriptional regulator [Arthrobacter sp. FW306-2-2C-D06B]|uniref:helix-turn-helix transcriptional regulator n=1 Tax=Arthrobacter sp. FW306-2-2C-D06B TaxID=2879618 RepID=UPI001F254C7D|nr:helix-turn-helix domain-containing protein [Arthrobacter sp. FW306-2-2C-D06B]UKA59199.1 helix-turn-helix domain-containing protein [Arthrobacter sp. FW306-2-2C-D06B]